jgi:lipid A 4'-phosphatase
VAVLGLWLIIGIGISCGIVFTVAPSVDLAVAEFLRHSAVRAVLDPVQPLVDALRNLNLRLTILVLGLSAMTLVLFAIRRTVLTQMHMRAALLIVLAFSLAPGLLVNGLLKEFWGRPRPHQVVEFGGPQEFKAWWDPTGSCPRNCSFVSGEASSAFAMLAVAAAAPPPAQMPAIGVAVVYGLLIGFVRMVVGGHFLSDVVFAGVFTALIVWLLHGWLFRWREAGSASRLQFRLSGLWRQFWELSKLVRYSAWDARGFGRSVQ